MTDADFRAFLRAAQGEEPAASAASARWLETEALAQKLIASMQGESALKALGQESGAKKRWDLRLLAGLLHEALAERAPEVEALEVVADKLAAAEDRDGVLRLLPHFLEPEPVSAAVRFLHYLARGAADDAERIGLLDQALAIRPLSPELHAELAAATERAGDAETARDHRLRAAELFLEADRPERVGEDLLRAIDEDLSLEPVRVAHLLLHYAAHAPWDEAEPLLELALPEIEARVAGHLTWTHVAPAAGRAPATPAARAIFARLLRLVVAREPDPEAVVTGCGILNPALSIETVGGRLERILTLPPGARAAHAAWGLGRVLANDGESVTLAFPGKEGHRMTLAMAARSLDRLPADGLRVLSIESPERLRALAAAGDAELVVAALRDLGGTGTVAQLKQRIEGAAPGLDWSAFWKEARDRLREDPRIDGREAYRQVYRLAIEGARPAEASLPGLSARAGGPGLNLLKQFLREHPGEEVRIREHAAAAVASWARDIRLEPAQRAQALSYLHAWGVLELDATRAMLGELVDLGLAPEDVATAQTQGLLMDLAEGLPAEPDFLWRAVASRHPRLRERGRSRLRTLLGEEGFARAVDQRVTRPSGGTGVAARLLVHYADHAADQGAPGAGTVLLCTIRLLERERELAAAHAESLLELLADGGSLHRAFVATPPDGDTREALERTVLHWQGSERRLHPILEFLRDVGCEPMVHAYESRRSARALSLVAGRSFEDFETRHTVMTRATYQRLEEEARRIGLELRTSIPRAIEKARALGDLRENAEYEAAKQRQANAAARLQALMETLTRARLLETIEIDPSKAGIGTEVELEPVGSGRERLRFWILGEGDSQPGSGIVSYRAPVAKPLLGKSVGAEVMIPTAEGELPYRIASITKRLPEGG